MLGQPFFVMDFLEADRSATPTASTGRAFIELLHDLHDLDWRGLGIEFDLVPATPAEATPMQAERWRDIYRASTPVAVPLLEEAAAWLIANAPPLDQVHVVHGDAGPGNFVHRDGQIVAVTDFEFCHLGDPAEDWAFCATMRGHRTMERTAWIDAYRESSASRCDEARWSYWEAFNLFKGACANLTTPPRVRRRHQPGAEHAGRRHRPAPDVPAPPRRSGPVGLRLTSDRLKGRGLGREGARDGEGRARPRRMARGVVLGCGGRRPRSARGVEVVAVELPLTGLTADAEVARAAIEAAGQDVVVLRPLLRRHGTSEAARGMSGVAHLVYLAAFQSEPGEDPMDLMETDPSPLLSAIVVPDTLTVDPDRLHEVLYADSDPAVVAEIGPKLRPMPLGDTWACTDPAWKSTPSTYVVCRLGPGHHPDVQRTMARPGRPTSSSGRADHSPFLTRPEELADLLTAYPPHGPASPSRCAVTGHRPRAGGVGERPSWLRSAITSNVQLVEPIRSRGPEHARDRALVLPLLPRVLRHQGDGRGRPRGQGDRRRREPDVRRLHLREGPGAARAARPPRPPAPSAEAPARRRPRADRQSSRRWTRSRPGSATSSTEHGPRSVALYAGTFSFHYPVGNEVGRGFMKALGSPMRFSSGSIDQPGKGIARALHGSWSAGAPAVRRAPTPGCSSGPTRRSRCGAASRSTTRPSASATPRPAA